MIGLKGVQKPTPFYRRKFSQFKKARTFFFFFFLPSVVKAFFSERYYPKKVEIIIKELKVGKMSYSINLASEIPKASKLFYIVVIPQALLLFLIFDSNIVAIKIFLPSTPELLKWKNSCHWLYSSFSGISQQRYPIHAICHWYVSHIS